jgi:plasmid stabilization system protein ParE
LTVYEVEITNEALADMEELYNYIATELLSPENAMEQYNRIADRILTLDTLPERHGVMDIEPGHSRGTRVMPVDNYSVFYVVKEKKVYVTDILYSASDIIARLKNVELFKN